ncbi:uncharacterized protein LOC143904546 [Temnothorax americanus]|uniref:uncharacterized protein LOC143904546 n=1 Tax=Temnothorax americanus TaxID=1964332 RepID=UPI004068BB3E
MTKKNFDGSVLPPSKAELKQHILRSIYIANIWRNAHRQQINHLMMEDFGWKLEEDTCSFKWFEGDQMPISIDDIVVKNPNEENEDQSKKMDDDEIGHSMDDLELNYSEI